MARAAGDERNYRVGILDTKGKLVEELAGLPSVTTVIGDADGTKSEGLKGWTYNVTAAAIAELLEAGTITPGMSGKTIQARLRSKKRTHYDELTKAQDRGTAIHDYAERLLLDKCTYDDVLEGMPREHRGYAEALVSWHKAYRGSPAGIERVCVSLEHGYAGTADLIDQVPSPTTERGSVTRLVDYKTSSRIHETHFIQGDAYALAWEEMARRRGTLAPIDLVTVVRFGDDGTYEEKSRPPQGGRVFLKMLELYLERNRKG